MTELQIIAALQSTFGEEPISKSQLYAFLAEHELDSVDQWIEFDEDAGSHFLSPETLNQSIKEEPEYEALGLGEVEEVIINALEKGKTIPWGRLALAMWIFFLFIVVYTILDSLF